MILHIQVLEKRFNATNCILDMSRFHYDNVFLSENIMPLLWDPAILRQVSYFVITVESSTCGSFILVLLSIRKIFVII